MLGFPQLSTTAPWIGQPLAAFFGMNLHPKKSADVHRAVALILLSCWQYLAIPW